MHLSYWSSLLYIVYSSWNPRRLKTVKVVNEVKKKCCKKVQILSKLKTIILKAREWRRQELESQSLTQYLQFCYYLVFLVVQGFNIPFFLHPTYILTGHFSLFMYSYCYIFASSLGVVISVVNGHFSLCRFKVCIIHCH